MNKNTVTKGGSFAAIIGLLVSTSIFSVQAIDDFSECIELKDRQPVELELSPSEGFANCFTIDESAEFTDLSITSMSEASFMHQVFVYEKNDNQAPTLLGTYDSDTKSLSQVTVRANGHPLAVSVLPEERQLNKQLKIQYLLMGSTPQVVIELYNRQKS